MLSSFHTSQRRVPLPSALSHAKKYAHGNAQPLAIHRSVDLYGREQLNISRFHFSKMTAHVRTVVDAATAKCRSLCLRRRPTVSKHFAEQLHYSALVTCTTCLSNCTTRPTTISRLNCPYCQPNKCKFYAQELPYLSHLTTRSGASLTLRVGTTALF
jgi:hypothetical protein